jgi:dTDP-4-dehydrorhamnose 3,5-epimerase-like enzyme
MSKKWPEYSGPEGSLVPIEFADIPFEPKRVFYVYGAPQNQVRGMHAHHTTQQVLTCLRGKIKVGLDDGKNVTETTLNENESIFVDQMIWDSQIFLTEDTILMSICSSAYDLDDYILDYSTFKKLTGNK